MDLVDGVDAVDAVDGEGLGVDRGALEAVVEAQEAEGHAGDFSVEAHGAAAEIAPVDWDFVDPGLGLAQGGEEFDIEKETVFVEEGTNSDVGFWAKEFAAALRIVDTEVEKAFDEKGEDPSDEMAAEVVVDFAVWSLFAGGDDGAEG